MSGYLRIRKWVDGRWSSWGSAKPLIAPAALVLLIGTLMQSIPYATEMSIAIAVGWIGFTIWRGIRVGQAISIKGDRAYDREGKFKLSSDYHGTESATAARRRRRNG